MRGERGSWQRREGITDPGETGALHLSLVSLSVKWTFDLQSQPPLSVLISVLHKEENAGMENASLSSIPVSFLRSE